MAELKAVTKEMATRYAKASKAQKGLMLDELCALTGWTRRHARRALGSVRTPPRPSPRPRARIYGPEVAEPLKVVWATLNGPAGKRLAPFMSEIVEALERCGELEVSTEVRGKLLAISAATIDRLLASERARLRVRGRSGTKPGSILRRQIPIRTFADWDERLAGFCEVDLVAHEGGDSTGEFAHTLNLTCVKTGWDEMRALPNKAQRWVEEAIDDIRRNLPFPLLGLDSDNGSEFINNHLFRYCAGRGITFTRTRPYRKNDNCFVEQKNWPVIRQQVGYARYDTPEELRALAELYTHLRYYVNFFQPQMKLVSKSRRGATVTKRFDAAATPYQRVLACPEVPEGSKTRLREIYAGLNPAQLKRELTACQDRLLELGRTKGTPNRKEVSAGPGHPWRDNTFPRGFSRTFSVRQPTEATRTS